MSSDESCKSCRFLVASGNQPEFCLKQWAKHLQREVPGRSSESMQLYGQIYQCKTVGETSFHAVWTYKSGQWAVSYFVLWGNIHEALTPCLTIIIPLSGPFLLQIYVSTTDRWRHDVCYTMRDCLTLIFSLPTVVRLNSTQYICSRALKQWQFLITRSMDITGGTYRVSDRKRHLEFSPTRLYWIMTNHVQNWEVIAFTTATLVHQQWQKPANHQCRP